MRHYLNLGEGLCVLMEEFRKRLFPDGFRKYISVPGGLASTPIRFGRHTVYVTNVPDPNDATPRRAVLSVALPTALYLDRVNADGERVVLPDHTLSAWLGVHALGIPIAVTHPAGFVDAVGYGNLLADTYRMDDDDDDTLGRFTGYTWATMHANGETRTVETNSVGYMTSAYAFPVIRDDVVALSCKWHLFGEFVPVFELDLDLLARLSDAANYTKTPQVGAQMVTRKTIEGGAEIVIRWDLMGQLGPARTFNGRKILTPISLSVVFGRAAQQRIMDVYTRAFNAPAPLRVEDPFPIIMRDTTRQMTPVDLTKARYMHRISVLSNFRYTPPKSGPFMIPLSWEREMIPIVSAFVAAFSTRTFPSTTAPLLYRFEVVPGVTSVIKYDPDTTEERAVRVRGRFMDKVANLEDLPDAILYQNPTDFSATSWLIENPTPMLKHLMKLQDELRAFSVRNFLALTEAEADRFAEVALELRNLRGNPLNACISCNLVKATLQYEGIPSIRFCVHCKNGGSQRLTDALERLKTINTPV